MPSALVGPPGYNHGNPPIRSDKICLWEKLCPMQLCDIGLIGLAVMGQNLVLNMNDHGFKVAVFNRTVSKVDDFLANEAKGTQVVGAHSIEELASLLKRPRRVMLMVKAGDTVDQMIDHILPHLEAGDIIIDGGNSLYTDSNRRTKALAEKGILFIGTGVSGGEEGARRGPSIMQKKKKKKRGRGEEEEGGGDGRAQTDGRGRRLRAGTGAGERDGRRARRGRRRAG